MKDKKQELIFEEELQNAIKCMEYRLTEIENECMKKDILKALEFIKKLPEIIRSACVLAVYAGENWATRQEDYGFGADGYEYCDKYIKGAMELANLYGTEDFYDEFMDYFKKEICP